MVKTCDITINPGNIDIKAEPGENLLKLLQKAEYDLQVDCGGQGTCGRCQVQIVSGEEFTYAGNLLSKDKLEAGYRLACQLEVQGDLEIEIPESSLLAGQQILIGSEKEDMYLESQELTAEPEEINPLVESQELSLNQPSLQDNTADLDRIYRELAGETTFTDYTLPLAKVKELPELLRENDWEINLQKADLLTHQKILDIKAKDSSTGYGLAVDIGTTTVVAALIDLADGREKGRQGEYNRQSRYGEDVISRINYASKNEDGVTEVHESLIATINELIEELLAEEELESTEIKMLMMAGNTTMIHTLMKVNPNNIRRSPFVPNFFMPPVVEAQELGLKALPQAPVYCFPAVGSFVGGDITAGILASRLHENEDLTMLIDIGTNGEIVVGNESLLISCSASAGPAFEGGGISCGIRAMEGAIEQVGFTDDFEFQYRTIGNKPPRGVCGSGLIDLLATMQEKGIINRSGRYNREISSPRLRQKDDETYEFLLVPAEETDIGEDLAFSENDIKHLLRSKGAIYAAIKIMLDRLSMDEQMLAKVYIAGGFGNYLNVEASIRIGLLPDLPRDRFQFIGNSALKGARRAVLKGDEFKDALELAGQMTYLELSSDENSKDFMDEFVAAQFIPHTDLSLFPSLINEEDEAQE